MAFLGTSCCFCIAFIAIVATTTTKVVADSSTNDCLANLYVCRDDLQNTSTIPSNVCCAAVRRMMNTRIGCFCGINSSSSFNGTNMSQAVMLPARCDATSFDLISLCKALSAIPGQLGQPTRKPHLLTPVASAMTPVASPVAPPGFPPYNKTHGKSSSRILIISLGLILPISFLLLFMGYYLWRKFRNDPEDGDFFDHSMDEEFEKVGGPKEFPYQMLSHATKNFAESEKLGEGGFGGVYKGSLRETDCEVAIKRVSRGSKQGLKEYQSEVKIISQLKHKNLVQLLGWCHKKRGELLLVYEFMSNGSLDYHLFNEKRSVLTWDVRYNIARGLASALLYLHEEGICCVVHRDIKTSNIMLDSNFDAKLGDFGLARLVDNVKGSQTTIVAGTMGYMAPEYFDTGVASKESDVYSFGVVLLEIACGRKSIERLLPLKEVKLVEWVWSLYGMGRLLDAADPKLDTNCIEDARELESLLVVGLWCAHPDFRSRPSIRTAISVLASDDVDQLPSLPFEMPVARYDAPIKSLLSGIDTSTTTTTYMTVNSRGSGSNS